MIIDTSALVAIVVVEADRELYIQAMSHAPVRRISAGTFLELAVGIERQFEADTAQRCDALLRDIDVVIEPVTVEQAYLARQAFRDFGRGRHPAGLNFGDCFAYALAKSIGEPLLFKGDDFRKTDVLCAL